MELLEFVGTVAVIALCLTVSALVTCITSVNHMSKRGFGIASFVFVPWIALAHVFVGFAAFFFLLGKLL